MTKLFNKCAFYILDGFITTLGFFLAKIPHSFFVFHIKALAWVLNMVDKRRKNDARANLDFVFEQSMSEEQKRAIIKRCYQNFVFILLESVRLPFLHTKTYEERFSFHNEHFIVDSIARDGGAILVSAHFGYWEAMASVLPPRYTMCQMASLGRLTQFESINTLIIKHRELKGVKMIDKKGAMRHLIKMYSQKNALVGILIDQNIGSSEGIEVKFFGKRTTHTIIASVISRRFKVAIVPVFIDYNEDYSRYNVEFKEPIYAKDSENSQDDILHTTQAQADVVQSVIESNPSSYFWFHKRFKSFYPEIYAR